MKKNEQIVIVDHKNYNSLQMRSRTPTASKMKVFVALVNDFGPLTNVKSSSSS